LKDETEKSLTTKVPLYDEDIIVMTGCAIVDSNEN
jgi:hypothetical protein